MDLKFSEITVDTTLAQEYLKNNDLLLKLHNDYNGTIEECCENGKDYLILPKSNAINNKYTDPKAASKNMALKLRQNATLIAQLEYHIRNIPMEVTHAQINLLIQYFRSWYPCYDYSKINCQPDESLLALMFAITRFASNFIYIKSEVPVPICYLLVTLWREAGITQHLRLYKETEETSAEDTTNDHLEENWPVKGLDSGTVAVVSDDADVDSAVDKFISVSKQAPWRLRRILVQESVYQEFKEALTWKCKLNKSGSKPPTHNVLCSATLTYNDKTYLIDPVQLVEEQPSVVTVEAYRTTKEMISLVQQYKARYLSLWINGVAEINEVTHNTSAPVVWVNTVADFRGPAQVSRAVFSQVVDGAILKSCPEVDQLRKLSQSWLKLDFESRRDILCGVLDEYILLEPKNKLYTDMKDSISSCTHKSFVDVGKDYVCVGMVQPIGILATDKNAICSVKGFESILQGNAFIVFPGSSPFYTKLEQSGVPVVAIPHCNRKDFNVPFWDCDDFMRTRVIWTNSGTIFAN